MTDASNGATKKALYITMVGASIVASGCADDKSQPESEPADTTLDNKVVDDVHTPDELSTTNNNAPAVSEDIGNLLLDSSYQNPFGEGTRVYEFAGRRLEVGDEVAAFGIPEGKTIQFLGVLDQKIVYVEAGSEALEKATKDYDAMMRAIEDEPIEILGRPFTLNGPTPEDLNDWPTDGVKEYADSVRMYIVDPDGTFQEFVGIDPEGVALNGSLFSIPFAIKGQGGSLREGQREIYLLRKSRESERGIIFMGGEQFVYSLGFKDPLNPDNSRIETNLTATIVDEDTNIVDSTKTKLVEGFYTQRN